MNMIICQRLENNQTKMVAVRTRKSAAVISEALETFQITER